MKIETKRKILWWVKRVINYCEYADKYPYLVIEERKILKVQSRQIYPNQDFTQMLSEDQMKYYANQQLIRELEKNKIIKYVKEQRDFKEYPDDIIYTAMLKVIKP